MKNTKRNKQNSVDNLKRIAATKFKTTMIFPLSILEISFGSYWGQGLPEDQLTPEQLMNRKKWNECRNNILNMGNNQLRGFLNELDQYSILWEGYKTDLVPIEKFKQTEELN